MKKIIFSVIMLVLVVSCKNGDSVPYEDKYKKGEEGLVFEFIKGAPPLKAYEESEIPVGITLRNKGGYDITQGKILLNLEQDYMKPVESRTYDLKGRSLYNPNGEFMTQEYSVELKAIDAMSEKHKSAIIATACYLYAAETVQNVCIDSDVLNIRPTKKVCEVKDLTPGSQGGPIAITKIEQRTIPKGEDSIMEEFTIFIANKGKGMPADFYSINTACGGQESAVKPNYWNLVHLKSLKLSSTWYYDYTGESVNFKCQPNPVKLESNEGKIVCTTSEAFKPESSYITQLSVRLEYGYVESISSTMDILRKA
jgi:hypothetical protein